MRPHTSLTALRPAPGAAFASCAELFRRARRLTIGDYSVPAQLLSLPPDAGRRRWSLSAADVSSIRAEDAEASALSSNTSAKPAWYAQVEALTAQAHRPFNRSAAPSVPFDDPEADQ